eukprot:3424354-Rhodomonas_salina.4
MVLTRIVLTRLGAQDSHHQAQALHSLCNARSLANSRTAAGLAGARDARDRWGFGVPVAGATRRVEQLHLEPDVPRGAWAL